MTVAATSRPTDCNDAERHVKNGSFLGEINQLLELQRLSIQKAVALSESEKENLSTSLKSFLESQKSYQELNQQIADLTSKKLAMEEEKNQIEQQLAKQREPAEKEFRELSERHRLRLAFYQLAMLIPLLLVAGYLLMARRGSIYFPLFLAVGGATLLKVALVIHKYFPTRYSKYVLILALLAVVIRLMIYLIRISRSPITFQSVLRESNPPVQLGRLMPCANRPRAHRKAEGGGVKPSRLIARPLSGRLPSPVGLTFRICSAAGIEPASGRLTAAYPYPEGASGSRPGSAPDGG